jgi:hypothetical protein
MRTNVEFSQYIAPDSSVYDFDEGDRFLMSEEGMGMPPINYLTQKGPFQHGETLVDYRLRPRVVQLQLRQDSCSRGDYWDRRALLINMIRPNRFIGADFVPGTLRKIFEDGSIKDLKVVIEEGPAFAPRQSGQWDEWGFTETLRFIAYDPTFFNPIQKSEFWNSLIGAGNANNWVLPWTFPFSFGGVAFNLSRTTTYLGTWLAYPKITITGPINLFRIDNISTGEYIELTYNLGSGDHIIIELPYGNKKIYLNTDIPVNNLIGTVTTDSDLDSFHVAPEPEVLNGENTFVVSGTGTDANSKVLIEYYERFIGI